MKDISGFFIAVMLCLFSIISCKTTEIDLSACKHLVTEDIQDKEISVKKGDTLCVKLLARMGTGFGWHVEKSSHLLKQLGNPLQIPEGKGGPGSADFQIFQFIAQEAGKAELSFVYKRVWEKKSTPEKQHLVRVIIKE